MTDTLVWITGASAGLGAALATAVPFEDAHVVCIARSPGPAGTEHLPADLTDPAAWSAVEAHLLARLGSFDGSRAVFVHNAGTLEPIGFAGEVASPAYRDNVLLNSAAGQVLGHAFLRAVSAGGFKGEATVVMVSSGAAKSPYPGWSAYCAGKAALEQWVRAAGKEQRARGTSTGVLAIAPGVVATRMQEQIRETGAKDFPPVDRFHELHTSGQLRPADDVARDFWRVVTAGLPAGTVTDLRD